MTSSRSWSFHIGHVVHSSWAQRALFSMKSRAAYSHCSTPHPETESFLACQVLLALASRLKILERLDIFNFKSINQILLNLFFAFQDKILCLFNGFINRVRKIFQILLFEYDVIDHFLFLLPDGNITYNVKSISYFLETPYRLNYQRKHGVSRSKLRKPSILIEARLKQGRIRQSCSGLRFEFLGWEDRRLNRTMELDLLPCS